MMNDEVIALLSNESGIALNKISEHFTLLGDLNIDGDDAWNLFEECSVRFNLDLTDFHFDTYFRSEPCFKGVIYLYRKIKYRDEHIAANKTPITVKQLITACNNGKLDSYID